MEGQTIVFKHFAACLNGREGKEHGIYMTFISQYRCNDISDADQRSTLC